MSAGTSPTPKTNVFIFCTLISFPLIKEKAGHLSTVATKEQVEIGLSLQTQMKEYNTFGKRIWDIHVHRQNKDMDMSLLMAVANYYQLGEYGVKRICFRGGSREALRDWRVLFPRSFEVWTGTGRKMKRLRGEQATGAGLPQQQHGLKVPMASADVWTLARSRNTSVLQLAQSGSV